MLTVLAPAKINLTLEVLAERSDGFHEIRSVIQTINLCDSLNLQLSPNIEFKSSMPDLVPEESLISKATSLLRQATGCSKGAAIEVTKRIPLVSGLGGDSSDAAAILCGLNELWGLGLSRLKLVELASQLGSDVAFFVYGGTAVVRGRGEVVNPLPPLPRRWVVVMMPAVPRMERKTERLYARLKASYYTDGQVTEGLVALLNRGGEVMPSSLFNVFDGIARDSFTGLGEYWQRFVEAGTQEVHLAGSGPALFTLIRDRAEAERLYRSLQQRGLESYVVETMAAIDDLV